MHKLYYILLLTGGLLLAGCAASLQPFQTEPVTPGLISTSEQPLTELPPPKDKVVTAVYRFRDQTGQYKPSEQVASWSTAVTQGATSILIRSLENSGWFIPIEREGLSNLFNERKIIQATREAHGDRQQLSPLLFAGVILEGGIIGYDTNILTGGAGLRYLGTGGSGQFRKDQVTIYLRAVSTSTGRVLKTVHTTKSILSQELQGGGFRFVDTNRLLEAEAGFTYNEPPVMAVTEAIDEAVRMLVIEGVDDNLWAPADPTTFEDYKQACRYKEKREEIARTDYFGMKEKENLRTGLAVTTGLTYGSYIGSYKNANHNPGAQLGIEYFPLNGLSVELGAQRSYIGAEQVFSRPINSADLLLNYYFMPRFNLTPFAGIGGSVAAYDKKPAFADARFYPAVTARAGLDYRLSGWLGVRAGIRYRYLVNDGIDGIKQGTVHDQLWNIETGITIRPNF